MPQKSPKFSNKNAQHSIEYVVLLTLVMAGIIIGGAYAIRSWNAQAKGWEDSVVDSMTDPLTQAPTDSVIIAGCDFVSWGPCGFADCCGLGYSSVGCTDRQLLQRGVFNPAGCELSDPSIPVDMLARCNTNDTNHCCTDWRAVTTGCDPLDLGCPRDADCGTNATAITGVRADGQPGCEDGFFGQTHTCDTGYVERQCVRDPLEPAACDFTCNGPPNPPILRSTFCAGDAAGLSGDMINLIVNDCTAGRKCEYDCNAPFVPRGGFPPTTCDCPIGLILDVPSQTCRFSTVITVAATSDNGTNDQSAATSALLCVPGGLIPVVTSINTLCPTGSPSGATPGNACTVELW